MMEIDSKTAHLIVEIYRNIQSVKEVLKTPPFTDSELLFQSGHVLDALMNQALAMYSNDLMLKKITALSKYVKELKHLNSIIISNNFQITLTVPLDNIFTDLELLKNQIKI